MLRSLAGPMLRSLAVAGAAALVLAGCGDDDEPGASAPPGISGTVAGQPFTPVDSSSLVLSAATSDFGGVSASSTGLLLGFSTFEGLCGLVTDSAGCADKANASIVTALVVRANVLGGTAGPVQPGTYAISAGTPLPDAQGNISVAQALIASTDAACASPAGTPLATSGTVRIDSIGANVTGSADLTFEDGSRVSGAFSAPACGFQTDVCTVLAGGGSCPTSPCVP